MCVYIYIKYIRRRDDDLTQASLCIFAYHNIHLIETAGLFIYNKRPSRKRLFVFIVYISLSLSWKEKEFLSSYQIFVSGKIQKYINSKKKKMINQSDTTDGRDFSLPPHVSHRSVISSFVHMFDIQSFGI